MFGRALLPLLVLALGAAAAASPEVLRLDADSFEPSIASRPFVAVAFVAPWCAHCKRLEPEWRAAASKLAARGRNIGEVLFKEAMRACRALDFRYMLFVERDGGSGKLIKWYEAMGFRVVPPDVLPGLDRAMVGYLPPDQTFYDVEGVAPACGSSSP